MSPQLVLLDACTLVPIRLTSCLLALAERDLFIPLWSDEILQEVERNLPKVSGITVAKAKRRVAAMRTALDAIARVDAYQHLMPELQCHPKDRHVLAAAIAGGADVLLTFNLRDFPPLSLASYGVSVSHPDAFLTSLLNQNPGGVLAAIRDDAARYRTPPTTLLEYLEGLSPVVPGFAHTAASLPL